jgi:hypothetical protein
VSPVPRYRQVDCLGRAGLAKRDLRIPNDHRLDVPAGETLTLAALRGPGRIVRIWMTTPVISQPGVLRDAVLRIYWDDEQHPSVECPLGDFFGAGFGRPVPYAGGRLAIQGGAYTSFFEMPFRHSARIEVENTGSRRLRFLFFHIGYYEQELGEGPVETFHTSWRRQRPTEQGQPFQAVRVQGQGRLVGLRMDLQAMGWWLRPPFREAVFPRGLGLGMLEGPERIHIDGEPEPSVIGTGAEDFFLGGWYFRGGPFHTATHGVTVRSILRGRVSAYRMFEHDPIPFERALSLDFVHGTDNNTVSDYTATAYWYQAEPHEPFPALPPAAQRRPASCWRNLLQWAALALGAAASLGAVLWLLLALWGRQS